MTDVRLVEDLSAYHTAIPDVRRLFEEVFERPFPSDVWEQWYFRNPYGDPLVVMGYANCRVVAHQAFIPQMLVAGQGTPVPYVLSISSMVDKRSRNWTLFNDMMHLLQKAASRRGYPLTLVLPNSRAGDLYRVLYGYRTLVETPLCTWCPSSTKRPRETPARLNELALTDALSYPTDSTYWHWRTSVNGAQRVNFTDSSMIIVKVSDSVLTVLDVLTNSHLDGSDRLWAIAKSLGAAAVRLTAVHASVLGLAEKDLIPHEGYTARLMCRQQSGEIPKIRFSLLLSDAF